MTGAEFAETDCYAANGPTDDVTFATQLRVGGLFVILVASAIGAFIPLLSRNNRLPKVFVLGQTFAAGVVLATGFVHVLPDADTALSNPCLGFTTDFPVAFVLAAFAAILTLAIEVSIAALLRAGLTPRGVDVKQSAPDEKEQARTQANIMSYTLEAGIIFHSIFIGIGYGASTDLNIIKPLSIALLFHQGFEGLALGSSFVLAGYSRLKYGLMAAAFILITPIGIAIGLGISSSFNSNSRAALASEGAFNSISAGILIHTALVGLLHPMFTEQQGHPPLKGWLMPFAMIFALAGCGAMCVIAIWA
ncbi:Fe(2+) transport protein 1 [Coccomyxa sp. Obi]|nr:Fe(2+) transport protein 1 [Coccomyxa sp. Obi]